MLVIKLYYPKGNFLICFTYAYSLIEWLADSKVYNSSYNRKWKKGFFHCDQSSMSFWPLFIHSSKQPEVKKKLSLICINQFYVENIHFCRLRLWILLKKNCANVPILLSFYETRNGLCCWNVIYLSKQFSFAYHFTFYVQVFFKLFSWTFLVHWSRFNVI